MANVEDSCGAIIHPTTYRLCFSESFESLATGLQNALFELGGVPQLHQTDSMSAAVRKIRGERTAKEAVSAVDTWAARTILAFLKWAKAHDVVFIFVAGARKSLETHLGPRELALRADVNIRCYLEKPGLGRNIAEVMTNPYAVTPKWMAIRMNVDRR